MATVWAHRVGAWEQKPETGWSHTFPVQGLSQLMDLVERASLRGVVTHLGIVAHGDQPGVVQLDRLLTSATTADFRAEFQRLRWYLTRDAMLTFYSCIAGQGERGSQLLIEISRQLPGRTIVGFEVFGLIGPSGLKNAPGHMIGTDTAVLQFAMDRRSQLGRLDPWCPFAKRARDARIVHLPMLEQKNRYNKTCAYPGCPGHKEPRHSCSGW